MRNREIILITGIIFCLTFFSYFIVASKEITELPKPSLVGIGTGGVLMENKTRSRETYECVKNPEISFFMYHYIRDDDIHDNSTVHNLSIPPSLFDEQMREVAKLRDESTISLMYGSDFIESWKKNCFEKKKIWIFTTDDSWSDTYSHLAPIAKSYDIPFFFGAIENRVDTPGFISKKELQELVENPLFTLSSHSMTHSDHSKMKEEREKYEICTSKKLFEEMSGKKVETYIYPSGRIGSGSIKILEECGYILAWSTNFGETYKNPNVHPYILNRTRITRNTNPSFFRDIALGKSYKQKQSPIASSEISAEEYLQVSPNQRQNGFKSNF